jgi:hypothetical protein
MGLKAPALWEITFITIPFTITWTIHNQAWLIKSILLNRGGVRLSLYILAGVLVRLPRGLPVGILEPYKQQKRNINILKVIN